MSQSAEDATVEGLGAWRHMMSSICPELMYTAQERLEFSAQVSRHSVGGIWMSTVSAAAHRVERIDPAVFAGEPSYSIQLQLEGTSTVTQDGRTATMQPGDFVAFDTSLPFVCDFPTPFSIFVAIFPQETFSLPPRIRAALVAQRMQGGSGMVGLASALMSAVAKDLDTLERSPLGVSAAHSMRELVMAALGETLGTTEATGSAGRLEEFLAIKDWIMQRLGDPTLSPEQIAAAHFISVRKLQGLFHEYGTTMTEWIRDRRLDLAARDLAAPLKRHESMAAIAERWGFSDPSYFSRAFRGVYGTTPREYRSNGAHARARVRPDLTAAREDRTAG